MKKTSSVSTNFHRVNSAEFPKRNISAYYDETVEVVQAIRSLKFYYRFKLVGREFVYWTEQFDLGYLQRIKQLRRSLYDSYNETMSEIRIPADILGCSLPVGATA